MASWVQVGSDISGQVGSVTGQSVGISNNGRLICVGAPLHSVSDVQVGQASLCEWDAVTAWTGIGSVTGTVLNEKVGSSVSVAGDGTAFAIGCKGYAAVYLANGTQRGSNITDASNSINTVALSTDGTILAVGANLTSSSRGSVRVYVWDTVSWAQRGATITGEATGDRFGTSVCLSGDGNTLAVGAPLNNGTGADMGHVRVFTWDSSSWVQRGADIDGEASYDWSGWSVAMSADGTVVAIGATNNENSTGHVRVYAWNSSSWVQLGADISGVNVFDKHGYAVSLSDNGTVLAVGAPYNGPDGAIESGHARVYDWTMIDYGTYEWLQRGDSMQGDAEADNSGMAVCLSADGNTLAIGTPGSDHVRVFRWIGIQISETSLGVTETVLPSTSTESFTVSLSTEPFDSVTLSVTSSDTSEVTVSDPFLTFTTGNWATGQPITVTAVDDLIADSDTYPTVTVAWSSGKDYENVPDREVTVTVHDNDAGIILSETTVNVSESSGSSTFTVQLRAEPTSDVVLSVSASNGQITLDTSELTFTPLTWNTPQTVTVTAVNDPYIESLTSTTVTVQYQSGDAAFSEESESLTVLTTSDDVAGITVAPSVLVINEGASDEFTVVLDARPDSTVFFSVSSDNEPNVTVDQTLLQFEPYNWNVPQAVTVRAVADSVVDGTALATVTVAYSSGSSQYIGTSATVDVTANDLDTADIMVDTNAISVEEGTNGQFNVRLGAAPTGPIVLSLTSANPSQVAVINDPATLTFTPGNWDEFQQVTVYSADTDRITGSTDTVVTVAYLSGDNYSLAPQQDVTVTTTNFNTAGISTSETAVTVSEAGPPATFDVWLTAEPDSDVTLSVDSSDTSEATVFPTELTFTPLNWSTPQTVTVTGFNDTVADGDILSTIAIEYATGDANFAAVTASVEVTTTDNETPSIRVLQVGTTTDLTDLLTVSETGTTAEFDVRLGARPVSNVMLSIFSSNTSEVTVDPIVLTFTSLNWNTSQTVTVTGVSDAVVDGPRDSTITVEFQDGGSGGYDSVAPATVTVRTLDVSAPGILLYDYDSFIAVSGQLMLSEDASEAYFDVALAAEPESSVTLSVTSDDETEVIVAPESVTLTFTPLNWNINQHVRLIGVSDALADGAINTTVRVAFQSGSEFYSSVIEQTVSVRTADTTVPTIVVDYPGEFLAVSETGSTAEFTVRLGVEPTGTITLSVTSDDLSEVTVSDAVLTFDATNWSDPQPVTVTGVSDALVDGAVDATVTVAYASGSHYSTAEPINVPVRTADATTPFFIVTLVDTEDDFLAVSEAETTAQFTVRLGAAPTETITVSITADDPTEVTVSDASLTFTTGNWALPQTVTVTGVSDALADGHVDTFVTVAHASGSHYSAAEPVVVSVRNADTTVPTIVVGYAGEFLAISESETTAEFTVRLGAEPTGTITLSVTSNDPSEVAVSDAVLTFDATNWSTQQIVTVTGVPDALVDGPIDTTVTVAYLSGSHYSTAEPVSVPVRTADINTPSIQVALVGTEGDYLTVSEAETTAQFTVRLGERPVSDIVLSISSSDETEVTVNYSSLTFTTDNWDEPQTVTVTGVSDDFVDGAVSTDISVSYASGSHYGAAEPVTVTVVNTDAQAPSIRLLELDTETALSGTLILSEAATYAEFSVRLGAKPGSTIVLQVASSDTSEATVSPATLTFTTENWNTSQTVRVTGADDALVDGTINAAVSVSYQSGSIPYSGVTPAMITVSTSDNETPSIRLLQFGTTDALTDPLSVTEANTTARFDVRLGAQPTANVTLSVTSSNTSEANVDEPTLTFTPLNWNTSQTITVTGVDETTVDGPRDVTITVGYLSGSSLYSTVESATVLVVNTDNDSPSIVLNKSTVNVYESGATDTFTVRLGMQPLVDVVLAITSADPSEVTVDPATVTFTPANWHAQQTVQVLPGSDNLIDGDIDTIITVMFDDTVDGAETNPYRNVPSATLTARTYDNDVAAIVLSAETMTVYESLQDHFSVHLAAQPDAPETFTVSSSDETELTVSPAVIYFDGTNWNVDQPITVTAQIDSLVDGPRNVTVTVLGTSEGTQYAGVSASLTVTVTDAEAGLVGIIVSTESMSLTENGTDGFTVVLAARPEDPVTVDISSDNGLVTVTPASLEFTAENWDVAQTVDVARTDNEIVEGAFPVTITVSTESSVYEADPQYITVSTLDNDVPSIVVSQTSIVVQEGGSAGQFTVALGKQPASTVDIIVTSDSEQVTVDTAMLTFDETDWDEPRTINVTALDNGDISGSITANITLVSDTGAYPAPTRTVEVTVTDNEASVILTHDGEALTVTETAEPAVFRAVLSRQPTETTVYSVTAEGGYVTLSTDTLTFEPDDWDEPKTVSVTAVNNSTIEDETASSIMVAYASGDNLFVGNYRTITVLKTSDDFAGLVVYDTEISVTEGGDPVEITVHLAAAPNGSVVLNVTSSSERVVYSPATLEFNDENWDTDQVITVQASNDSVANTEEYYDLLVSVNTDETSSVHYQALADPVTVSVAVNDNDVPGLVISHETLRIVDGYSKSFTVHLACEPSDPVTITMSGNDMDTLLDPTTVTIQPADFDTPVTVFVAPAASDTINVVVTDSNDDTFAALDPYLVDIVVLPRESLPLITIEFDTDVSSIDQVYQMLLNSANGFDMVRVAQPLRGTLRLDGVPIVPDEGSEFTVMSLAEFSRLVYSVNNATGRTRSRADETDYAEYQASNDSGDTYQYEGRMLFRQGAVPCFLGSTPIRLARTTATLPARLVRAGHVILDHKEQPHKVVRVQVSPSDTITCIEANTIAPGCPRAAVWLTPNHLIRLPDKTHRLAGQIGTIYKLQKPVLVYHFLLDDWVMLDICGMQAESCAWKPNHHARRPFLHRQRARLNHY